MVRRSRTPQGGRGLKLYALEGENLEFKSHSARSAWIETLLSSHNTSWSRGRTPQGVRGLKLDSRKQYVNIRPSHSARSAWIETLLIPSITHSSNVALRKECVD